jgi:hypothetical protein
MDSGSGSQKFSLRTVQLITKCRQKNDYDKYFKALGVGHGVLVPKYSLPGLKRFLGL